MTDRTKRWDYLAVSHLHGATTRLGAFVVAMIGRQHPAPCFSPAGIRITRDGRVLGLFKGNDDPHWTVVEVYQTTQELTDTFLGLADALKLDAAQTELMFEELRKFIRIDERVKTDAKGITRLN